MEHRMLIPIDIHHDHVRPVVGLHRYRCHPVFELTGKPGDGSKVHHRPRLRPLIVSHFLVGQSRPTPTMTRLMATPHIQNSIANLPFALL